MGDNDIKNFGLMYPGESYEHLGVRLNEAQKRNDAMIAAAKAKAEEEARIAAAAKAKADAEAAAAQALAASENTPATDNANIQVRKPAEVSGWSKVINSVGSFIGIALAAVIAAVVGVVKFLGSLFSGAVSGTSELASTVKHEAEKKIDDEKFLVKNKYVAAMPGGPTLTDLRSTSETDFATHESYGVDKEKFHNMQNAIDILWRDGTLEKCGAKINNDLPFGGFDVFYKGNDEILKKAIQQHIDNDKKVTSELVSIWHPINTIENMLTRRTLRGSPERQKYDVADADMTTLKSALAELDGYKKMTMEHSREYIARQAAIEATRPENLAKAQKPASLPAESRPLTITLGEAKTHFKPLDTPKGPTKGQASAFPGPQSCSS